MVCPNISTLVFPLVALVLFLNSGEAIKCSVCDTAAGDNQVACLIQPPAARECADGHDFCINVAKYTPTGTLRSFTRSCSPFNSPPACVPGVEKTTGEAVQICYSTCSKAGCNGSRSLHNLLDLLRRR